MTVVTNATILEHACSLIAAAKHEVCLTSPWITEGKLRTLLNAFPQTGVKARVIFRVNKSADLSVTRANAMRILRERPNTEVRYNRTIHAKTILVDGQVGIISSANITRAGMSKDGNQELGVTIHDVHAKDAQNAFETMWAQATPLPIDCIGFLLNPTSAHHFTFVALDPSLSMGTLVRVQVDTGWLFGRVTAHHRWNRAFFADPYASEKQTLLRPGQAVLRPGHELLPLVDSSVTDWNFANMKALTGELQGGDVLLVDAVVEAYVKDGVSRTSLKAPPVGSEVHRGDRHHLTPILNPNGSVEVGLLIAQDVPVGLTPRPIASQHLAVMGMTGSGKSNFMKVFLDALKSWSGDIFVFDPHGEYDDVPGFVSIDVPADIFFFADKVAVKEYVKVDLSQEVRVNNDMGKIIIPDAWRDAGEDPWRLPTKVLESLRVKGQVDIPERHVAAAKLFEEWYPQFEKAMADGGRWAVRLKQMDDSGLRTDIVGLLLSRLYQAAKSGVRPRVGVSSHRPRLVVLEEAHSVIPERSEASDVQSGKDNFALREATKIASEGRKFDIGLIVVTQRPAKVNKGVLSQCNTQVLFRLRNSNDLGAVASSVEGASRDVLDRLPEFHTGDCLISGIAIPFPLICRVHEFGVSDQSEEGVARGQ